MDLFYTWLGTKTSQRIRLAVLDMWKPFRTSTLNAAHAPQAKILFDKFHVLRHLKEALEQVRKSEYARLTGKQRQFIKGQKYPGLSRRANLTLAGRRALQQLLHANKRLHTAYLLTESFGQLGDDETEGWARRFFDNWRAALKGQRLKPYEKFADLIERHWAGIAAYCHPENKVARGFVEGLNNKIRGLQRRAYGLRDEEYLRLKILTCLLPEICNTHKLPTHFAEEPEILCHAHAPEDGLSHAGGLESGPLLSGGTGHTGPVPLQSLPSPPADGLGVMARVVVSLPH